MAYIFFIHSLYVCVWLVSMMTLFFLLLRKDSIKNSKRENNPIYDIQCFFYFEEIPFVAIFLSTLVAHIIFRFGNEVTETAKEYKKPLENEGNIQLCQMVVGFADAIQDETK